MNAPLLKPGIAVDSLYFTKAPGDSYLSVYARYKNNSDWIPLHIGLRAAPTLQQVRDEDRNISMNTGSYDDAHFYLRSADGYNMTTAFYTNASGGAIQAGNTEGLRPLHLQPEGGMLTYNGNLVATEDWVKANGLVRKNDSVTNFNNVLTQGIYNIYSGLASIPNYPHIGNNNNGATSGMLVVYESAGIVVQYFYPDNETGSMNRNGGYWYRKGTSDRWEYRNGILEISLKTAATAVNANDLVISGEYYIAASNVNQYITYGYPDSGASIGGIPFMLTVRKRFGAYPWTTYTTQEIVSMQESPQNLTRKWIRSKFNWQGENVHAWDAWNEVGLLRDVYTKTQLNTSGAGGHIHWDNIDNKPPLVNTETDPTVPAHVKAITTSNINSWNGKEDAGNKSSNTALGNSNTLYPTQNAVKAYVDNAISTNNTGFIPVAQKGAVNGIATLGANGKIPNAQIPALAITETFPVNNQAEMLALAAETGDVAVRNDVSKSFILKNTPATVLSNWIELKSPTVSNTDQVPEGTTNLYFTNARARNAINVSAPVTYNAGTGNIGITQSGISTSGYLSTTDWTTFNNKQNALGFTPENSSNKTTSLSSPNHTTYPTTQAVSTAISAAAANLQQTTDRGNTTTTPLIMTGSEGREVKTFMSSPTAINTIVSGTSFKWYNDLLTIGAVRGGSTNIDSFGIDINGNRRLTLDTGGKLTTPGQGDFGSLLAHDSITALNTQPYTSGAKFIAIWNGTSGRFEYTNEVFLKTETDPVFTNARPNLLEAAVYMTDINTVAKSGVSYTDPGTANTFTGDPYNSVLTFIGASNTNNAWVNQIVAPTFNGNDLYYRQKTNNSSWTAPKKFAFQDWVQVQGYQTSNIYNSDGTFLSTRILSGGGFGFGINSNLYVSFTNQASGIPASPGLNVNYSNNVNAVANLRTDNLTGQTNFQFPRHGGVIPTTVNGQGADADGNISISSSEQWKDDAYGYLSADSPAHGTGRGIYTNGGYRTKTQVLSGATSVADDVEIIIRLSSGPDYTLQMPKPSSFPGRVLKIRNATFGSAASIVIAAYPIYYYAVENQVNNIKIERINGDTTTPGFIYYTGAEVQSIKCTINGITDYYWIAIHIDK